MLYHRDPQRVLVIGGGASGVLSEVLRYDVEEIVYVEQDPLLIQLVRDNPSNITEYELNNPKVRIEETDGRRFLARSEEEFDVLLTNLPYPSSLTLNRFYTVEFFDLVSLRMKEEGILAFPVPGASGYLSEDERRMNKCLLQTLNSSFIYLKVAPDNPSIFLASNDIEMVGTDLERICDRVMSQGLDSVMPCQRLTYLLDVDREIWYWDSLKNTEMKTNRDLLPAGVFYSLSYWASVFSPGILWVVRIAERIDLFIVLAITGWIGLVLLSLHGRGKAKGLIPIPFVVGSTGFFGMGFNIMIILTFQSFFGYLYQEIELVLMVFMLGLSIGGAFINRLTKGIQKNLMLLEILIAAYCIAFIAAIPVLSTLAGSSIYSGVSKFLLLVLSGVCGFLVGGEFPISSQVKLDRSKDLGRTAGSIYARDVMGAVAGSLVISIILVPLLGIFSACVSTLGIKLLSLIMLATSPIPPAENRQEMRTAVHSAT